MTDRLKLEAGRSIHCDGKPFIFITPEEGASPHRADLAARAYVEMYNALRGMVNHYQREMAGFTVPGCVEEALSALSKAVPPVK